MKLVPHDRNSIGSIYQKTKLLTIIDEFIESGHECVKVEDFHHKNAYVCAGCIRKSIERFHRNSVECSVYRGEVYLTRVRK